MNTKKYMYPQTQTFTPSYERRDDVEHPFTPPSIGERLMASVLTATVWTGVLMNGFSLLSSLITSHAHSIVKIPNARKQVSKSVSLVTRTITADLANFIFLGV